MSYDHLTHAALIALARFNLLAAVPCRLRPVARALLTPGWWLADWWRYWWTGWGSEWFRIPK